MGGKGSGKHGRQGRKPTPAHMKRVPLTDCRIPRWLSDWLKDQKESRGKIIERALVERYGLKDPEGE